MKNILVPFDFSESAVTALEYALAMAGDLGGNISLLTVNNYPVMGPEVGITAFSYVDAKEDCYKELQKVRDNYIAGSSGTQITCFSEMGEVTDEIEKLALKLQAELIVMGIHGHANTLLQNLAGSSAVMVSKHSEVPVLIVPMGYKYKKATRIAFACKYGEELAHPETVEKVKKFCDNFQADLHMIHIIPEGQPLKHTEVLIDNYTEHKLEETIHRTFIISEKRVSAGLLDMLKNDLLDIIVIEPKKHNFFQNLFHISTTTELAFHSPVPVLTVH